MISAGLRPEKQYKVGVQCNDFGGSFGVSKQIPTRRSLFIYIPLLPALLFACNIRKKNNICLPLARWANGFRLKFSLVDERA